MTLTENIAIYAAILSSALFAWEIYKHFTRGAKINLVVSKNMVLIPDPIQDGKLWIKVTATNVGDQPTTLTSLNFKFVGRKFLSKKVPSNAYYVPNNPAGESLPR